MTSPILTILTFFVLLAAILAGNGPKTTPTPPPESTPVSLTYIGNSCILITAPDGTRIVSDPYNKYSHPAGLTQLPSDLTADAVTVSHDHSDHNGVKDVGGTPQIIDSPGTYQIGMIKITGYEGFEGSPSGPSTLSNTIFVFEIEGVKIVHLGDSGIVTDPDVLAEIENADVILVNIDGYVIPQDQIIPFMQQIHARTIMLTHYSLDERKRWQGAPTADEFLETLPADLATVKEGTEMSVTPDMPEQVAVLTSLAATE